MWQNNTNVTFKVSHSILELYELTSLKHNPNYSNIRQYLFSKGQDLPVGEDFGG